MTLLNYNSEYFLVFKLYEIWEKRNESLKENIFRLLEILIFIVSLNILHMIKAFYSLMLGRNNVRITLVIDKK